MVIGGKKIQYLPQILTSHQGMTQYQLQGNRIKRLYSLGKKLGRDAELVSIGINKPEKSVTMNLSLFILSSTSPNKI